jgi:L-iditol 2-dehydrogenase
MTRLVEQGLPLASMCTHDVNAVEAGDAIEEFLAGRTGKVVFRW